MAKTKTQPGLTPQLQARLLGSSDLPTQREFVEEMFRLAGGPRALAKQVWSEFSKPNASPMLRTRVLELLLRALDKMSGEIDPDRLVQQLPDSELIQFAKDNLTAVLKNGEVEGGAGGDQASAG